MNRTLAAAVFIIIEAGIEELAERIKQRKKRDGHSDGLDQSTVKVLPVGGRRPERRTRERSKS
ncbi:hypothetical protein ACFL2Q_00670 [Thermodesulfobacteriota bacterium]